MATFKHISSKNADYGAAEQYLTFEHDEFTMKPTLDENGRLLPRDAQDNGLTVDRAQQLGEQFCKEHFPGHQALVCTHPDGHNHSGNIHVHIVINSLRIAEVPLLPYMERPADTREGCKHRCTDAAMEYFKAEVMEMCHRENLYQIDLLNGSKNRITEREYWAKRKGQAALSSAVSFEDFSGKLLQQGVTVKESRGRLSYLTPDRTKPITARKLGDDFDRANLLETSPKTHRTPQEPPKRPHPNRNTPAVSEAA